MELIKIINAKNVIDSFAEREDIGAHLSYWMTKFVVKTQPEHDFYIAEMRKLFNKYADKTKETDEMITIPPENVAVFNQAVKELECTDVEDPEIRFFLSELSAELKISMKQMYPLLDFIDESK